jgi:DNA invertase Pin-like site-specific DNA recombinase
MYQDELTKLSKEELMARVLAQTAQIAILGVAAKLERRRVLERTARGRADAKAKGVKFGRKPILTPHQEKEARKRLEAGETQRSVARSYNVSQSTISRLERQIGYIRADDQITEKRQGTQLQKSQRASRHREQQSYKHLGRALPNAG